MKFLVIDKDGEGPDKIIHADSLEHAKNEVKEEIPDLDFNEAHNLVRAKEISVVPLCPACEKPLDSIHFEQKGCLDYENQRGYEENEDQVSITYFHDACGNQIGFWASDGS